MEYIEVDKSSFKRSHIKFKRRLKQYFNIDYDKLTSYQKWNIELARKEIKKIIIQEYEFRKLRKELSNNKTNKKRIKI